MRERPVLVYDGDCALCSSSVRALERWIGRRPEIVAWQHTDLADLGLTEQQCEEAVQWVDVDSSVVSAHLAVARTLVYGGKGWRLLGHLLGLPLVRAIAGVVYRSVARNRHRLPGGTPTCALPQSERDARSGSIDRSTTFR